MDNVTSVRRKAQPNTTRLTIIAQDPAIRIDGKILLAEVEVPAESIEPGPCGYRVKIVDFDASTSTLYEPHRYRFSSNLMQDPFKAPKTAATRRKYEHKLLNNPAFHSQNVYAIVMRTLARFEYALGRRVAWGFGGHQLHVAPHAFSDANAFYSESDRGLFFGYFADSRGRPVFTCLSHDVVAHETTHAILDGLRDRYTEASGPDQGAFHEGFADVVALLSVFSLEEIVMKVLHEPVSETGRRLSKNAFIHKNQLTNKALAKSVVLSLGEEMGAALSGIRGDALRRSAALPPRKDYLQQPKYEEEHDRGEILVAAMLNSFIAMWQARIKLLATFPGGLLDKRAVVTEGAKVANHLLTMSIRALDYCPPVDITFSQYLTALLTADSEIVPDDRAHHYRRTLLAQFAQFGIIPRADRNSEGAWPRVTGTFSYSRTHFDSLVRDEDEVFRFLWENREQLKLDPSAYLQVETVRPCIRVGPDGFVLRETVATYVQMTSAQARDLKSRFGITIPSGMAPRLRIGLMGGGVLVFNEYGQLKYHIANRLDESARQSDKLAYLYKTGYFEEEAPQTISFAALHMRRAMGR